MKPRIFTFILLMCAMVLSGCIERREFVTIATASAGGTYYPIGVGIGNLWTDELSKEKVQSTGQSSAGSVENIQLLQNGEAQVAILMGLIGVQAYEGRGGNFEGRPYKELRSIAMLWSNVEHFVLMNKEIKTGTISDIDGKTFSIGPQASGTEQSTLIMMEGLGLTKDDIKPEYLGYDDTISAMRDGRLAGGSLSAGIPVSAITDMSASGVKASLLDVTDEQLKSINGVFNTWFRYEIPAGTYPGIDKKVNTIAQPNFLATTTELDADLIYKLTKIMYENLGKVHGIHSSAKEIQLKTALNGLSVPLHEGAYRYFKQEGLDIPDRLIPPEVTEAIKTEL